MEWASFVAMGAVAAICEKAEGREAVSGTGGGKAGGGKVNVPSTGLDTVVEGLTGGVQLTDALGVGSVSSHISGDPPICELLASIDKEGENLVGPSEQLAEPLREGFEREVLFSFAGVIGESMEGMGVDFSIVSGKSAHSPFRVGGVEWGDPDVPSPSAVSEVRDDEGGETSLVVDEVDGASVVAGGDGGGGSLGSDSSNLGLKVGSELVVDRRAVDEGVGEVLGNRFEVVGREAPTL
jgi:hypothetical protein